jgi:hypothetical protein
MKEPPASIVSRDEVQRLAKWPLAALRVCELLVGATRSSLWRTPLQWARNRANRRAATTEVPFGFDGLLDPASQVNAQIIQDDDLSWLEAGGESLLDVDLKGGRIGGSIQQHGFPHARER